MPVTATQAGVSDKPGVTIIHEIFFLVGTADQLAGFSHSQVRGQRPSANVPNHVGFRQGRHSAADHQRAATG
jgi:hypothetical protein